MPAKSTALSPLAVAAAAARAKTNPPAKSKPIDGKATVVKNDDLPSLGATIAFHQKEIEEIGRKAKQQALPLQLKQGLACLKAQALLSLGQGNPTGKNQHSGEESSDSEDSSEKPANFTGWIAGQEISIGSAYDYMRAVEGLGLTHKATEKQLLTAYDKARKTTEGDLSITKLKNLAAKDDEEEEQPKDSSPAAKAGEARVFAKDFIRRWDTGEKAGNLEHADKETLTELAEFCSNTLERIRKRLKSAR